MQKRNSGNNRLARINEELKREISNIINYEVKNSNVTGMVSVTSAKITPDLRYAKITVSILNSKNVKQTLAGLKAASGFIRSRIAEKINLRITPELVFELDETMKNGERIDRILAEIMKEIKPDQDEENS
jgi:ribosome-binding factor A